MQTIKDREFLNSSKILDVYLRIAQELEKKEKFLFDSIHSEDLNEMFCTALTKSIVSSYTIDHEYLEPEIVRSYVNFSAENGIERSDDYIPKEKMAVNGIMSCLNMKPLSHEMMFTMNGFICGNECNSYRNCKAIIGSGREIIYEAPRPKMLFGLMDNFFNWWTGDRLKIPASIGSAMAHYMFVSIHPFAYGNGIIARSLAEKALITSSEVFCPYSVSAEISKQKHEYYEVLRTGNPHVFICYMLDVHEKALDAGIKETERFVFLREFFNRDIFSENEKNVIRIMSSGRHNYWFPQDFSHFPDGESIFFDLQSRGVIDRNNCFNPDYQR